MHFQRLLQIRDVRYDEWGALFLTSIMDGFLSTPAEQRVEENRREFPSELIQLLQRDAQNRLVEPPFHGRVSQVPTHISSLSPMCCSKAT